MKKTTAISSMLALFSCMIMPLVIGQFGGLPSLDGLPISNEDLSLILQNCGAEIGALTSCAFPNGLNTSNPEDEAFLAECSKCLETELEIEEEDVATGTNGTVAISCLELDAQVQVGISACQTECRVASCEDIVKNFFSCIFRQTVDCETGELKINITEVPDGTDNASPNEAPVMAPAAAAEPTTDVAAPSASSSSTVCWTMGALLVAWFMRW